MLDINVACDLFWEHWNNMEFLRAIEIYNDADRPFWLTDTVAEYYEEQGQLQDSIWEWEHLIASYLEIRSDFLPLTCGPASLYKVAVWYADKNTAKAIRYLKIYLSAREQRGRDPSFFLQYEDQARTLLNRLDGQIRTR